MQNVGNGIDLPRERNLKDVDPKIFGQLLKAEVKVLARLRTVIGGGGEGHGG